jgi:hypothetical protein
VISLGHLRRRLLVQGGIVQLRTLSGTVLDQAGFRGVRGAELRSLAGEPHGLLVLQTYEGGGSLQWDGYELVAVTACWLTETWQHPTLEISSGPDSLQVVDTAGIEVQGDSIRVVGFTVQRYVHDDGRPSDIPDTRCQYDQWWVWQPDSGRFVLTSHREQPSGACAI